MTIPLASTKTGGSEIGPVLPAWIASRIALMVLTFSCAAELLGRFLRAVSMLESAIRPIRYQVKSNSSCHDLRSSMLLRRLCSNAAYCNLFSGLILKDRFCNEMELTSASVKVSSFNIARPSFLSSRSRHAFWKLSNRLSRLSTMCFKISSCFSVLIQMPSTWMMRSLMCSFAFLYAWYLLIKFLASLQQNASAIDS